MWNVSSIHDTFAALPSLAGEPVVLEMGAVCDTWYVAWRIHVCGIAYSCVWHDPCKWCMRCAGGAGGVLTMIHVWHDSFICATWLSRICDIAHLYVTWLIHICDMTESYCDMARSHVTRLIHMWHDSFIWHWRCGRCVWHDSYVTWLIYMW